jgi:hypothetical protein
MVINTRDAVADADDAHRFLGLGEKLACLIRSGSESLDDSNNEEVKEKTKRHELRNYNVSQAWIDAIIIMDAHVSRANGGIQRECRLRPKGMVE